MGQLFQCDVCENQYPEIELAETYIPPEDSIDEKLICHECAYGLELFLQEIGGE